MKNVTKKAVEKIVNCIEDNQYIYERESYIIAICKLKNKIVFDAYLIRPFLPYKPCIKIYDTALYEGVTRKQYKQELEETINKSLASFFDNPNNANKIVVIEQANNEVTYGSTTHNFNNVKKFKAELELSMSNVYFYQIKSKEATRELQNITRQNYLGGGMLIFGAMLKNDFSRFQNVRNIKSGYLATNKITVMFNKYKDHIDFELFVENQSRNVSITKLLKNYEPEKEWEFYDLGPIFRPLYYRFKLLVDSFTNFSLVKNGIYRIDITLDKIDLSYYKTDKETDLIALYEVINGPCYIPITTTKEQQKVKSILESEDKQYMDKLFLEIKHQ